MDTWPLVRVQAWGDVARPVDAWVSSSGTLPCAPPSHPKSSSGCKQAYLHEQVLLRPTNVHAPRHVAVTDACKVWGRLHPASLRSGVPTVTPRRPPRAENLQVHGFGTPNPISFTSPRVTVPTLHGYMSFYRQHTYARLWARNSTHLYVVSR